MCGRESVVSPFSSVAVANPLMGSGHGPAHFAGELEEPDRKGLARDRTVELSANPEVYELATRRTG